jgi:hypothetical protein
MKRARGQTKQFTLDVKGMGAALRGMGAAALLNPITAIGAGIAGAGAAFVKAARSAEDFNRALRRGTLYAVLGKRGGEGIFLSGVCGPRCDAVHQGNARRL